jgi:hypothetical protein
MERDDRTREGRYDVDIVVSHTKAAVQEDEGLAFTDDLVAEFDPVYPGNTGGFRRHSHIVLTGANVPCW